MHTQLQFLYSLNVEAVKVVYGVMDLTNKVRGSFRHYYNTETVLAKIGSLGQVVSDASPAASL